MNEMFNNIITKLLNLKGNFQIQVVNNELYNIK